MTRIRIRATCGSEATFLSSAAKLTAISKFATDFYGKIAVKFERPVRFCVYTENSNATFGITPFYYVVKAALFFP